MLKTIQQLTVLIFGILLFAEAILPVTVSAQDYEGSPFGAHGYYNIISDISDVGIKIKRNTAKEGLVWDLIDPELDGNYNWTNFDKRIDKADSMGLNLMVTIKAYNQKDQASCHSDCIYGGEKCKNLIPCDMDRYESFLKDAIDRYKSRIKYWQIDNEPNERGKYFSDSPENYAELMSISYKVIKASCPDCQVLMAGSAGFQEGDSGYHNQVLAILHADYDCNGCFDIFDVHTGGDVTGGYTGLENTYTVISSELAKYGYSNKPIWSTEFGSLSKDGQNCQTTQKDGEELIKLFATALSAGFEKLFWRVSECPSWIIDKDGEKTATYYSYQTLINKLEGFNSIEKLDDGQYKFIVNEKKVYVLWCDSGSCSLPSEITGEVKVTDYSGDEKTMSISQIILGKSPVFIEEISNTSIEETGGITPNKFRLTQNYPNPFNPTTTIIYQLPVFSKVTLKIYDVLGNEVRTLVNENKSAGSHSVVWNGKDNSGQQLSSGVYFYSLKSYNNFSQIEAKRKSRFFGTNKMLLIK